MAVNKQQNSFVYQHRLANGEIRWVEAHVSPLLIRDRPALFSIIYDITDRQRTAEALRETEQRLRLTLEAAHVVAWELEPHTGKLHDIGPVEELFGQPAGYRHTNVEELLAMIHPGDREMVRAALEATVAADSEYNVEYRLSLPGGKQRWIEATGQRVIDAPNRPARLLGAARDISERKWAEQALYEVNEQLLAQVWKVEHLQQALREQAIRDPLSGLYNRWYLDEALQQEFARARRDGHSISLIMMDIDHFKELNDTHGHLVGDEIIAEIGGRLKHACREGDIVCRYGGEEYVAVLRDVAVETALERAEQCRASVQASDFEVESLRLTVTVSAGVAAYPQHANDAIGLIRAADLALYRAKANGRNCVVYYGEYE
jgi:diguanylate cyclase (GGDEF)-like protein/PAS domain S-box-containing protein